MNFPYIIICKTYKENSTILDQAVVHSRSNPTMILKNLTTNNASPIFLY